MFVKMINIIFPFSPTQVFSSCLYTGVTVKFYIINFILTFNILYNGVKNANIKLLLNVAIANGRKCRLLSYLIYHPMLCCCCFTNMSIVPYHVKPNQVKMTFFSLYMKKMIFFQFLELDLYRGPN